MNTANKKVILFGLLGAAAVGTTLYVLLGKGKGGEWKQKLSDNMNDIACRVSEYFTGAKDKLKTA